MSRPLSSAEAPHPEAAPESPGALGAAPTPGAPSEQAPEAKHERRFLLAWYCSLLGGILPVLLLGFLYSALADRLAFAGWALVVATLYTVLLRQGLDAGWPPAVLAGLLGILLAAGFGWFAGIERTHHEILDLGFRAVFPGLYHAAATRPSSAGTLAVLLAAAGLVGLVAGFRGGRRA